MRSRQREGWIVTALGEQSVFARFRAEKGEGVHHIALATFDFDDVAANQIQRGNTLPHSGTSSGVNVAYLPTGTCSASPPCTSRARWRGHPIRHGSAFLILTMTWSAACKQC